MVRTRISDDAVTITPTRLAEKLGLSTDSVSEVRRVMAGNGAKPNEKTLGNYFKVLGVSEEDQNYVFGIDLAQTLSFPDLLAAIQASDDFGAPRSNEKKEIRDKKIQARLARDAGDLEQADALSAEIEKFQTETHFYDKLDLEISAEDLAKTRAFRGSLALQNLDFKSAFAQYSQIPKINGLSKDVLGKFANPIRLSFNTQIFAQENIEQAREVFDEMKANGVTPNVVSYTTLMTYLETEAEVREVFDEMKTNGVTPNEITIVNATRKIPAFEDAISFLNFCISKDYYVGRGAYEAAYTRPITHLSAAELLAANPVEIYKIETALQNPMRQYRREKMHDQAVILAVAAPHVGAAQKLYRDFYDICKSHFEAELAAGNDQDNLHYGYGIAAALNADWPPARTHLDIALERCFENADKRRDYIKSLIQKIPARA